MSGVGSTHTHISGEMSVRHPWYHSATPGLTAGGGVEFGGMGGTEIDDHTVEKCFHCVKNDEG